MKIARSMDKMPHGPLSTKEKTEIKKCYHFFNDQKELEQIMEKNDNKWISFNYNQPFEDKVKARYESFVWGYLHYYDERVRNNAIDHIIHFKWESKRVTIYICPPPGSSKRPSSCPQDSLSSDPIPPSGPPPPPMDTSI